MVRLLVADPWLVALMGAVTAGLLLPTEVGDWRPAPNWQAKSRSSDPNVTRKKVRRGLCGCCLCPIALLLGSLGWGRIGVVGPLVTFLSSKESTVRLNPFFFKSQPRLSGVAPARANALDLANCIRAS